MIYNVLQQIMQVNSMKFNYFKFLNRVAKLVISNKKSFNGIKHIF